VTLKLCMCWC